MKLKNLFDPKIILSSVTATLLTGALLFYASRSVPLLRNVQRGLDGGAA